MWTIKVNENQLRDHWMKMIKSPLSYQNRFWYDFNNYLFDVKHRGVEYLGMKVKLAP